MILESSIGHAWVAAVWIVVLGVGFLTLIGLARAGSVLFWNVRREGAVSASAGASPLLLAATVALLAAAVVMSVFAEPLKRFTDAAALQLSDRAAYAEAVLGGTAGGVRPYRGAAPP